MHTHHAVDYGGGGFVVAGKYFVHTAKLTSIVDIPKRP